MALIAITTALIASAPAQAKKPDHVLRKEMYENSYSYDKRHGHHQESHNQRRDDHPTRITIKFDDERRRYIKNYLHDYHMRKCPPGLAKKASRCMPPGQAMKYRIGDMLPRTYTHLPNHLRVRLGPPPSGTFYAMVDQDVFLATEATKKILDAVTLFSAME
jgi:Ni/Co efflux regulator RcnB